VFGAALSTLPRAAILHAAESARLQRLVQQDGKRIGAARFVAGETLDECVGDAGLHANTTLLGEAIPDPEEASTVTAEYERITERLAAEKLKAKVALKLTHLGLAFDEEVAYANVERLVARAGERATF
jgi:proline dehydrogenase